MEKIDLNSKTIFVTGAAGFIGSNLVKRLFKDAKDATIVGIDNMNDYYDVALKEFRLNELNASVPQGTTWKFIKGDIADKVMIDSIFEQYTPQVVVNLAAQAGVRYSITNPDAYIQSNLIGFYNILEACRHWPVAHLVYASSSSVYGSNKKVPYSTDDKVAVEEAHPPLAFSQVLPACYEPRPLQYPFNGTSFLYCIWSCRTSGYGILRFYEQVA